MVCVLLKNIVNKFSGIPIEVGLYVCYVHYVI